MAEVADLLDGFQIGPHKVYPRREQISVDGEMRHVEPKVMQVLVTLAEHAQNTVSREDLLNRVWADAVVGDEVISRAVSLHSPPLRLRADRRGDTTCRQAWQTAHAHQRRRGSMRRNTYMRGVVDQRCKRTS